LNVAVTVLSADKVNEHAPVPLHAPDQPANIDPLPAIAEQVTLVPEEYAPDAQLAPKIVPVPAPVLDTVRLYVVIEGLNEAVTVQSFAGMVPDQTFPLCVSVPQVPEGGAPICHPGLGTKVQENEAPAA